MNRIIAVIDGINEWTGRSIAWCTLAMVLLTFAIVRGDEVMMAHHDTLIEADDHVILFLVDRKYVGAVEKIFQVDAALD